MTRRLILAALATATLAAVLAPGASAGEYPVYACEPAFGDVNHSWLPEGNSRTMVAYTRCPIPVGAHRPWNQGLVTRATRPKAAAGTKTVKRSRYAGLRLRAPAGSVLSRMTYGHSFCSGGEYSAGLVNDAGQWLHASTPGVCGTLVPSPWTLNLGGTPSILLATKCIRSPCHRQHRLYAWATLRSATVWIADGTTPSVTITGGSLVSEGWHRGAQTVEFNASDNVGVAHADVYIDGKPVGQMDGRCDWTYTVPCTLPRAAIGVDSQLVDDGTHALSVSARDSAGNTGTVETRVNVDNTAPPGPLDLSVGGGEGWRNTNDFDLAWINPPEGRSAPVAGAVYAICPATDLVDNFDRCAGDSRDAPGIRSLSDVHVPTPGDWVARVWLRDAAGNVDWRSARSVHLRYDAAAPDVLLAPLDPADPQRLSVAASDALSGLARVEVEISRAGTGAWIALPVLAEGNGFVARVDDAALRPGQYRVRVRALDAAANERTIYTRADGTRAELMLPLRLRSRLMLGAARRLRTRSGRHKLVLRRAPLARYGHPIPIRGRLTLPGGNPIADVDLEVFEQTALPGEPWRRIGLVHTDEGGRFGFRAPKGASRRLRFLYAGTPLIQPADGVVHVRVRAATTLRVNRAHVVNGDEVRFTGRVRGPLPRPGKLVALQAYSRGTWRTFATPRARPRTHRWSYRYRFSATRGTVRYRFRAAVPPEGGFPFERGWSSAIHVTVRGL